MANQAFTLTNPETGQSSELPMVNGTLGTPAVDVGSINKDHGVFTFDPAFTSTCSCESAITYIDGDNGVFCIAAIRWISWRKSPTF